MKNGDLCLVTGVSGYLASWLARELLDQGFRVRGTVRDLADAERLHTLSRLLPGAEFVAADLRQEHGWADAVRDCQWVFHVASPQAVKTESDRTGGAVAGTRHLLAAAFGSDSVRKIVLTSSEAAVAYGHPRNKRSFDESDWTMLDGLKSGPTADYFKSKTLAERLAWNWARDPARNPRGVPLATINPSFILGPSLVPWGRFSVESLRSMVEGRSTLMIDMNLRMVDVRDCARMHVALMNSPEADFRRHLCFGTTGKMVDLAKVVREEFGHLGFKPSMRLMPTWMVGLARHFSGEAASIYSHVGNDMRYHPQNPEMYHYRHGSVREIVIDTMHSMLEHGRVRPSTRGGAIGCPGGAF